MFLCLQVRSVQVSRDIVYDGKMEREMDRQIGVVSSVLLSIYQSIYVPTLSYGHKLWGSNIRRALGVETLFLGGGWGI